MNTECIRFKDLLPEKEADQKKGKPIEFYKVLSEDDGSFMEFGISPTWWKHIVLLTFDKTTEYDVMLAYCDDPDDGCVYIGHWNGGYVDKKE